MIPIVRNHSWQLLACSCILLSISCHTGNPPKGTAADTLPKDSVVASVADTAQERKGWTAPVIMVDSSHLSYEEAALDSLAYLPYTVGQKRTIHLGATAINMHCTGTNEIDGAGEWHVFDFAVSFKHKSLLALKGIYGIWTPCFSPDTSWFSISVDNYPGEFVSQKSLYVINTLSGQHYLVDTTLYDVTNTPIVQTGGKNFLLYINGGRLACYDIATRQTRKLADIQYKERPETATLVYRLSDLSYAQERLTGRLAVTVSGVTDEEPRQGFYNIPFSIQLKL